MNCEVPAKEQTTIQQIYKDRFRLNRLFSYFLILCRSESGELSEDVYERCVRLISEALANGLGGKVGIVAAVNKSLARQCHAILVDIVSETLVER